MSAPFSTDIVLAPFLAESATEADWIALNAFTNEMRAESNPGDPPRSLRYTKSTYLGVALLDHIVLEGWLAKRDGDIVGTLFVNTSVIDNLHMAFFDINVLPQQRRAGIGTLLLDKVAEVASSSGRSLLLTNTQSTVPAGAAFVERFGAEAGLASHTNQLLLADVDRDMLRAWNAGATRLGDFELLVWEGAYPDDQLDAMVHMHRVMNSQPFDDLEVEDFEITAEQLRKQEQFHAARNYSVWTMAARHLPTGEIAGFTDVMFDPENPENLQQGNTGVDPRYRGNGLGKWLKAAMLEKVFAERPSVKRIRTGNADSNDAMLAINHRLGFKPYIAQTVWQLPLATLRRYRTG